jgi:6-pyruvoyltetrahydropterin/6-carboxytetrahydropterin synthase
VVVDLTKQFQFEAAHVSEVHGVRRLHGHSYVVDIVVAGEVDPRLGWLIDYGEIRRCFDPLYQQLDHYLLNDVPGMEDVSLAGVRQWILRRLRPQLDCLKDVAVGIVGSCAFQPTHGGGDRMVFGFEAAHYLPALPATHKCNRMHGHSFRVEVGLRESLPIIPMLEQIYEQLDHGCLNEVAGLENPTSEHVCRWIWDAIAPQRLDLHTVTVAETCTARCTYHGS